MVVRMYLLPQEKAFELALMEKISYSKNMDGQSPEEAKPVMSLGQPEIKTPMAVPKRSFMTNFRRMLAAVGLGTLVIGGIKEAIPSPSTENQNNSGNPGITDTRERVMDPETQLIGQRKLEQIVIPGNSNAMGTLTDNPPIRKP